MDGAAFLAACEKVSKYDGIKNGIGTLGEKTLHAVLKQYYEPNEMKHEIKIGSFVADIADECGIIEIQTRSFDKLRKKLEAFLDNSIVTVVYPIAYTKWLYWIDTATGEVSRKRKSPKIGRAYEIFYELYKIKPLLTHENLRLCIPLLELEEYRYLNGWSLDGKKGSSRCDRIPIALVDEICIQSVQDYSLFLPLSLPEQFTTRDYKSAAGLSLSHAQTALHVLRCVGVIRPLGKQGRLQLYERC